MLAMTIPVTVPNFTALLAVSRSTLVAVVAVAAGMGFFCLLYFAFMVKKRREQVAAQKARSAAVPKKSLFEELSAAHVLTAPEQTFLRDLAKSLGLTSPALLLVEPKHLQDRASDGSEVATQLIDKLFGTLTPTS